MQAAIEHWHAETIYAFRRIFSAVRIVINCADVPFDVEMKIINVVVPTPG